MIVRTSPLGFLKSLQNLANGISIKHLEAGEALIASLSQEVDNKMCPLLSEKWLLSSCRSSTLLAMRLWVLWQMSRIGSKVALRVATFSTYGSKCLSFNFHVVSPTPTMTSSLSSQYKNPLLLGEISLSRPPEYTEAFHTCADSFSGSRNCNFQVNRVTAKECTPYKTPLSCQDALSLH